MKLLLAVLMWIPATLQADLDFEPVVSSYRVQPAAESQMDRIAERFEVVRPLPAGGFEIYVPAHRREEFLRLAPKAQLRQADIRRELLESLEESAGHLAGDVTYRSWSQVEADMQALAERFPAIVHLETYGRSRQGRPLYALKLSDNVTADEDEPELLVTSATHGDEIITVEVLWSLIVELTEGYGRDSRLTRMVDGHELYFVPVVNPDGFSRRSRYAGGVDPNRAYPRPDGARVEPATCIDHLIAFFHTRNFVGSMDIHAYGELVMFPWGYSREQTADDTDFASLAGSMAQANGYQAGQISRILYIAPGSSADYYYWKNRTRAFGVEIAESKAPSSREIPRIVDDAREMIWRFIERLTAEPGR